MNSTDRITIIPGVVIIGIGVLFLVLNLLSSSTNTILWPMIFFVIAIGFILPPLGWPKARPSLAALFIPGSILTVLGLIFLYNTLTWDWASWAYMWTLIPAGVGLGLTLASYYGFWGEAATRVGVWMLIISLAVFSVLSTLFGATVFRIVGPALLILGGLVLLFKALRKKT